jgi:hypothetical protein
MITNHHSVFSHAGATMKRNFASASSYVQTSIVTNLTIVSRVSLLQEWTVFHEMT